MREVQRGSRRSVGLGARSAAPAAAVNRHRERERKKGARLSQA